MSKNLEKTKVKEQDKLNNDRFVKKHKDTNNKRRNSVCAGRCLVASTGGHSECTEIYCAFTEIRHKQTPFISN